MAIRKLANLLSVHAPYDGPFELRVPGVYAVRRSGTSREPVHATLPPLLCVVAQGAKTVMLGREIYEYDPARMIVFSVDLPVAGQVTRATPTEPFLGFVLNLNPKRVAELARKVYPQGLPKPSGSRGVYVGKATDPIVDAVTRLVELMGDPADAELLAPLVIDEILIRLLRSSIGSRVAQIGQSASAVQRMAKAVSWIRDNFAQTIAVDQLAELVHMSVSSFHQRFKAVTSMSPLQDQKVLRLHEARRLLLFQNMDARTACGQVGYVSASQFSREYARFFGSPPTRDIARLREEGFAATDQNTPVTPQGIRNAPSLEGALR